MKLYFHNPFYSVHYGINVYSKLAKQVSFRKYWYLTEHLLKKNGGACIYADLDQNSFKFVKKAKIKALNRAVTALELLVWCWLNKINPFKIKIVTNIDKLEKNDIFFSFAFENLNVKSHELGYLQGKGFLKIFHLSHYMLNTSTLAANGGSVGVDYYVSENDLSCNGYFKRHFEAYKKAVYTLPLVFQERFINKREFSSRVNECLATGTFHDLRDTADLKDFKEYFKINNYHPMRKAIYQNRDNCKGLIASYISYMNEEIRLKDSGKEKNPLKMIYTKLWNHFHSRQSKYFGFNIVDKYNEYKMFVVPEEVHGLPAIGFVEGMACGGAYLGIDSPMYRNIGLVPGVHYIAYDNNIESLKEKIRYYQEHGAELEAIARRGSEYVREHFNGERVADMFFKDLERLSKNYADKGFNSNGLEFESSFTGG